MVTAAHGFAPSGANVEDEAAAAGQVDSDEPAQHVGPQRYDAVGSFYKGLVVIYMISTPFYLWMSGIPQVSDMLMVVLVFGLMSQGLRFIFHQRQRGAFMWLAAFTAYVIVVSLTWFLIHPSDDFLIFPLYYVFNTLVFACAFGAYARIGQPFLRYFAWGAVLSVTLQAVLSPFVGGRSASIRETLFFNNPNQLGYYALVSAAIILLSYRSGHIRLLPTLIGVGSSLWLASLSLSKAAILALGVLGVIAALGNTRLMTAIGLVTVLLIPADLTVITNVEKRLSGIGEQSDDSWEGRGYGRLAEHPEYLVFGAAEGAFERLTLPMHGRHEIHSSLATVLFSYGVFGFFLFSMFILSVCVHAGLRSALYLVPVMLYGMTHMGLREGLLWLLLAQMSLSRIDAK
jgi:hypothetical protein